jgi:RES domain-containing protein
VTPPLAEIAQQRTVRLVPAKYYEPPVLGAIARDPAEQADLERLQALTDRQRRRPAPHDNYDLWGGTLIRAAFTHTRVGGNRFNDEARGAWYAAFDERTALHEVAFHKTRELSYIDDFNDESRFRGIHASFIGRFHDLRGMHPPPLALDHDPDVAYVHGQALARQLAALEPPSRGLIYPSARHPGGTCIVIFQPNVVQDVHPGPEWLISWTGTADWSATPV